MIRRFVIALGLVTAAAALTLAPAGAQTYDDTVVASAGVNADGSVTVTGENCVPAEDVDYTVERTSTSTQVDAGQTTADAEGDFGFTTAPLEEDRHEITVVCGDSVTVLAVNVDTAAPVAAPAPAAGAGALPRTGADDSVPLARLGVILVAAGGVALYGAKKRNSRRAAFLGS
ncbi:MAG: LPXTG cell wall anchor domain-containing protein [Acidimicrobiia bacterium]